MLKKPLILFVLPVLLMACVLGQSPRTEDIIIKEDYTVQETSPIFPAPKYTEVLEDLPLSTSVPQSEVIPLPTSVQQSEISPGDAHDSSNIQLEKFKTGDVVLTFNQDSWMIEQGNYYDCLVSSVYGYCKICPLMPMGIQPNTWRYEEYSENYNGIKFDFVMYIPIAGEQPSFTTVIWDQRYQYEINSGTGGWDCYYDALDVLKKSAQNNFQ